MAGARTMVCNGRRPGQASQASYGLTRPKAGAASPEAATATAEDRATGRCVAVEYQMHKKFTFWYVRTATRVPAR